METLAHCGDRTHTASSSKSPTKVWDFAFEIAVYLINHLPTCSFCFCLLFKCYTVLLLTTVSFMSSIVIAFHIYALIITINSNYAHVLIFFLGTHPIFSGIDAFTSFLVECLSLTLWFLMSSTFHSTPQQWICLETLLRCLRQPLLLVLLTLTLTLLLLFLYHYLFYHHHQSVLLRPMQLLMCCLVTRHDCV